MEKPKVRFSHGSENAVNETIPKKVNHLEEKGKVKVKSIVPVNLPIKVLKSGKRLILKDNGNTRDVEVITKQTHNKISHNQHADVKNRFSKSTVTISSTCSYETLDKGTEVNSKQHAMSRPEMPISETPASYLHLDKDKLDQGHAHDLQVQNCTDKLQVVTIAETDKGCFMSSSLENNQSSQETCNPRCIIPTEIDCASTDNDQDSEIQIVHIINSNKIQQASKNKPDIQVRNLGTAVGHENKENKGNDDFHETRNKNKSTKNSGILKDATCSSYNNTRPSTRNPVKTSRKPQVMPCAKFKLASSVNKQASKQVKSHVKKRSLFNIAGKVNNVLVEPEMSRASHNEHVECNMKESCKNRDITSRNLLSQPEYNSAVSIMKKLKEIGEEKLIKDLESLPATYKSLVHGKVSAALDFGPYESVYKNLINLSVDDKELPVRLTRTKDPEPRNRDMVPTLDQFYNPKSTQEHFMSLDPQVLVPISVNTLNAFTISNKICTWRISRDSS